MDRVRALPPPPSCKSWRRPINACRLARLERVRSPTIGSRFCPLFAAVMNFRIYAAHPCTRVRCIFRQPPVKPLSPCDIWLGATIFIEIIVRDSDIAGLLVPAFEGKKKKKK